MASDQTRISHVSDTALMVAAFRALETARPDGLVRDPFSERLAGARGMAIAHASERLEVMSFAVGIRSRFIDELVLHAVRERGVDTVLYLGAGLDARPWRLDLPPGLRWIETDFPDMLDYKHAILSGTAPKCRLERMPADLNQSSERGAVLKAAGSGPALMITEGLLMYLPAATVESLATDAAESPGLRYWILDISSRELSRRGGLDNAAWFQRVRAADATGGDEILELIARAGWTSLVMKSYVWDALKAAPERMQALARSRPEAAAMGPFPKDDPSGIHLFERPIFGTGSAGRKIH